MLKHIAKRVLFLIPTILCVTLIVFGIMNVMPSDPGRIILGRNATQAEVDAINEELGYYDSFAVKFFSYITNALRGDFGKSYRTSTPVFEELIPKFPTTLTLAVWSSIFASVLGVLLGILSAVKQYTIFDYGTTVMALVFVSLPSFLLGLILIMLFALKLGWLPANGIGTWKHYILPVVAVSMPAAAMLMRISRANMLEVMRQEYIRTARAKGAGEPRVIFRHALKNTLLPVITVVGMRFAAMLGGTVIAETVFGLPGIGSIILTAITTKDIPLVMGSTVMLSSLFCVIMLVVDILYAVVDPRVKAKYVR